MSGITELFNIAQIAKTVASNAGISDDDIETAVKTAKLLQNAKAISATASKYVVSYPVMMSTRISDYKLALAITKQVELECARFIILSAGLDPVIYKNQSVGDKLNNLFTTSNEKLHFTITPASDDEFYSAENYLNSIKDIVKVDNFKKHSSFIRSIEMKDVDTTTEEPDEEPINQEISEDDKEIAKSQMGIDFDNNVVNGKVYTQDEFDEMKDNLIRQLNDVKDELSSTRKNAYYNASTNRISYDKMLTDISKVGPTIVRIKLIIDTNTSQTIEVPIAVKATLHMIDSSDCETIIKGSKTFSNKFTNIIKLISGETCFKEWLLQIEQAKRDVKREKEMGNIPFYRNLIDNKNRYRQKTIMNSIPFLKNFVNKTDKKDMPICTMVVSDDEIAEATGMKLNKFVMTTTYAQNILNVYMMLGLGIVDSNSGMIYFFFSGEDEFHIVDPTKVGSKGGNSNDATNTLLKMLGNTIGALTRH